MDFVVLPDRDDRRAATGPGEDNTQEIPHPSGRPLLRGRWRQHEILTAAVGDCRVVLLGSFDADEDTLARHAARMRSGSDLAALAAAVPGAYFAIASLNGTVHARGTLSSSCQLYYRARDGVTLAADRPQALADSNALGEISAERLAVRLLAPTTPWPFNDDPVWSGVQAVPAGHHLELDDAGQGRVTARWSPPAPDVPIADAAAHVRAALRGAVRARLRAHPTLSCDLSGGLDSTSLCFLIADEEPERLTASTEAERRLVTFRWEVADSNNDDREWAESAAARLAGAEHVVHGQSDAPSWFSGITDQISDLETPPLWIRTRAQQAYRAALLARRGCTAHLTGDGGDELFFATPAHLHALARRQPLLALSHARQYRAVYRWGRRATVAGLLRGRSFARDLRAMPGGLTSPMGVSGRGKPDFGWIVEPRLPSWATGEAIASVRSVFRARIDAQVAPLAPLSPQHLLLADYRTAGQVVRQRGRLTQRWGVSGHAPFLDDHVIEAALSVDLADATPLDRYKPALTEAMRGVAPAKLLERRTKHEFSADAYAGLRQNRDTLVQLAEDMRLEKLGLVDAAAFRAALTGSHLNSLTIIPLIPTLACEAWLRSLPDGG